MGFGLLCARRAAIVAALAGGMVIAVLGVELCAKGIIWSGSAFASAIRSGLALLGF